MDPCMFRGKNGLKANFVIYHFSILNLIRVCLFVLIVEDKSCYHWILVKLLLSDTFKPVLTVHCQ